MVTTNNFATANRMAKHLPRQRLTEGRSLPQGLRCLCKTASQFYRLRKKQSRGKPSELRKAARPAPCCITTATKKKQRVTVGGDSLLRGREHEEQAEAVTNVSVLTECNAVMPWEVQQEQGGKVFSCSKRGPAQMQQLWMQK